MPGDVDDNVPSHGRPGLKFLCDGVDLKTITRHVLLRTAIPDEVPEVFVDAHACDERVQVSEFGRNPCLPGDVVVVSRKAWVRAERIRMGILGTHDPVGSRATVRRQYDASTAEIVGLCR